MVASKVREGIVLRLTVVFHTVAAQVLQHIFVLMQVRFQAVKLYHARLLNVNYIHNLSLVVEQLKTVHDVVAHG